MLQFTSKKTFKKWC